MAFLRKSAVIISLCFVSICCLNDTAQKNWLWLTTDCMLLGFLSSLILPKCINVTLKAACVFGIIASLIFLHTSLKSYILFIPALACLFSSCAQYIVRTAKIKKGGIILLCSLTFFCATRSFWPHLIYSSYIPNRVAVLEHGKWGNALSYENKLTITSQYSYDFLHKLIRATKIENLKELEQFSELWLITPTKPFNSEEISTIDKWVSRGGRLVVISDHTDLFGHASALNPLLSKFNIRIHKNVILDKSSEGGTFYSFCGNHQGLSANSVAGCGETWLFQQGYSERTDYSKRSFFSDNQISDEENVDIYSIGLRVSHGLGGIMVFGDSTMWANFALSRPSSQFLLNKTLHGGGIFSCYAFAFFGCLSCLLMHLNCRFKLKMALQAILLTVFAFCCYSVISDRKLSTDTLSTVDVKGDWSLVEGSNAQLLTLFASAYVSAAEFPIWSGNSDNSRTVQIGGNIISDPNTAIAVHSSLKNVQEIIGKKPEEDIETILSRFISESGYSSFWFDDGIGLLREVAYRAFWDRAENKDASRNMLSLVETSSAKALIKARGKEPFSISVCITPIKEEQSWVILGSCLLGKFVSEDTILIRNTWQLPSLNFPDFYCKIEQEK